MSILLPADDGLQLFDHGCHMLTDSANFSAKPRKKQAKTLGLKEWEPHKARILELHVSENRPLNEVKKIMENERGFRAELRQYRRRISQWGLDKNVKPREMKAIVRKRQQRMLIEPEKGRLMFKIRGNQVHGTKISRWMKSHGVPESLLFPSSPDASTPSDLECRTLSACSTPQADIFERSLQHDVTDALIEAMPTVEFLKSIEQHLISTYLLKCLDLPLSRKLGEAIQRSFYQESRIAPSEANSSHQQIPAFRNKRQAYIPEQSLSSYSANESVAMFTTFFYMMGNGYLDDSTVNLDEVERYAQMDSRTFQIILNRQCALTESIAESLFRLSVLNNNVDLLQCLLAAGVDPNEQRCSHNYYNIRTTEWRSFVGSAFEVACYRGSLGIVQKLVETEKRAGIDYTIRIELLDLKLDLLQYLRDQGFDLSVSPQNREPSLLMRAALKKDIRICRFLIELGADVCYTDRDGASAILYTCIESRGDNVDEETQVALCHFLVAKGADVGQETMHYDLPIDDGHDFRLFVEWSSESAIEEAFVWKRPSLIVTLFGLGARMTFAAWTRLFSAHSDPDFRVHLLRIADQAIRRSSFKHVYETDTTFHPLQRFPEDILRYLRGWTKKCCLSVGLAAAMQTLDFDMVLKFLENGAQPIHDVAMAFVTQLNRTIDREKIYEALHLALARQLDRALHIACGSDNIAWIQALINQGANPNATFFETTALTEAICDRQERQLAFSYKLTNRPEHRKRQIVRALIDAGAKINRRTGTVKLRYDGRLDRHMWRRSESALCRAVILGEKNTIRYLISLGADPTDSIALCAAVLVQRPEILRLLLDYGGNPNIIEDGQLHSALTCAIISEQSTEEIDMLLLARANPNAIPKPTGFRGQRTPLQAAAEVGNLALVERLLDLGADINAPGYPAKGATALQFAAIKGFTGIAALLLRRGAEVNAPGAEEDGRTALEGAAEWGRIDMIYLLAKHGACINSPGDGQYERALEFATKRGRSAARRFLQKLHEEKMGDVIIRDCVHEDLLY